MAILSSPNGVSVISTLTGTSTRISWLPVTGAVNYKVYESAVASVGFGLVATTNQLTYFRTPQIDTDNIENLYWYKVSSIDVSSNESLLSDPYAFFPYAAFVSKPVAGLSETLLLGSPYPIAFPRGT